MQNKNYLNVLRASEFKVRKILLYILILIVVCFTIPTIFTIKPEEKVDAKNLENEENVNNETQQNISNSNYDYKKYAEIKLLHSSTNEVETIKLDEYLYGVVSAEMPASFDKEALKAQAVVARTYTIYKIINNSEKHKDADICDNSNCCQAWISKEDRLAKWKEEDRQAYWDKIVNAVNSTQGKIITYDGSPINAFFHANSGGATESPINVWGGTGYPYLQTVTTAGEDAYSGYQSEVEVTKKEFEEKIKEKHSDFKINFEEKDCIKIEEYTDGNRVKTLKVGNLELSGVEIRNIFSLRSANFKIEISKDTIKFEVIGYGHGVGMSQTGADSLAKQGKTYEDIIKHYYTDVKIENM